MPDLYNPQAAQSPTPKHHFNWRLKFLLFSPVRNFSYLHLKKVKRHRNKNVIYHSLETFLMIIYSSKQNLHELISRFEI